MLRRGARGSVREFGSTPWDALVVGLGNPGAKYRNTLHNVGAEVVELLAQRQSSKLSISRERALVSEVRFGTARVALAFPQTFMNESGQSVAPLMKYYAIDDLSKLIVVHDELDLEPGRLKLKLGGGLAGHNGLRSIKAHLHEDGFARVRVGVGKPPGGAQRGVDHVLSPPSRQTKELIAVTVVDAADAVEMIVSEGIEAAMMKYNQR
jgi:PTH1 family peptidyl-tRNA hydrolase